MAASSFASTPIKSEDNPGLICSPAEVLAPLPGSSPAIKDPEGYLRRCSGLNKKTNARCSATIGKNAKSLHSTFLPTCHAHKDQQSFAARCQFKELDGETCDLLFRWMPPYFKLCDKHRSHPDAPCHFMNLPLELRQEIFRYLLPTQPIGSSSSLFHQEASIVASAAPSVMVPLPSLHILPSSRRGKSRDVLAATSSPENKLFPFPLVDLFLISRRVYHEVKDLLYSSVPFIIDIRKDGTFMCGRRLLEPRRADGSAHSILVYDEIDAKKFTSTFDFSAVKHYNVDILVENGTEEDSPRAPHHSKQTWDEEVEIYDIRDYVGVVVYGILLKARNLCRLNVRLGFSKFNWSEEEILANTKCLFGPFERLRNVQQPKFCGIFGGSPPANFMVSLPSNTCLAAQTKNRQPRRHATLYSVPILPTHTVLLGPGNSKFDAYKEEWEKLASEVVDLLPKRPPIRAMFTEFKQFYTKLSNFVPEVTHRIGRQAFLHRARVARENDNVEAFRHLRNELIEYWHVYLEEMERQKKAMDSHLSRMLDSDVYPSHEADSLPPTRSSNLVSDYDVVRRLPTQGNPGNHKRKRPTMDTKQIRLGYKDSAQAGPSSSSSPYQLPDTQSMILNPSAAHKRLSLTQQQVHRSEAYTWVQTRALLQAQFQANTRVQAQTMSIAKSSEQEDSAQNPPSALRPVIPQSQTIMLPDMPEQQKMLPKIRGSKQVQRYHERQLGIVDQKMQSDHAQSTISASTTASKVAKIQMPIDRITIGSPMSVHTTISCQTLGSNIRGDSSTNSLTILDEVHGTPNFTQKQPYNHNDGNSQLPCQTTALPLKKRRINAATNFMDGSENVNETGYDVMMVTRERQQRQLMHDGLAQQCPEEYLGKGKKRAIENREAVCLN